MESILDWGLEGVLWFQQFSPTLDLPFKALTYMGSQVFFMLLLSLVYWCIDRGTGVRLTILFLLSGYINTLAKVLANQPRPFHYDPRVLRLHYAGGGGLPSGHTQSAVVVWGYLALHFRCPSFWLIAVFLMVFIPLSRIYLGVHFPTDLLGGYILGAAVLLIYLRLEQGVAAWLNRKGLTWQLGVALAVPILMILLFPSDAHHGVSTGATLMGMGVGFALERRCVGFEAGGLWWQRVLRFFVGAMTLFFLWIGLRTVFHGLEPANIFRFVCYVLTGLWGGLGAPWAFVKLRLAEKEGP